MADSEEPAAKMPKMTIASFSFPIKVLVGSGPNKAEFYLSKDLLCLESTFFKSACNDAWESGRTNIVTLDEEDPKLFILFATWITKGCIEPCSEYLYWEARTQEDDYIWNRMDLWHCLTRAYILGDFLGSRNFRNAVMKVLVENAQLIAEDQGDIAYHDGTVSLIYKNTNPGSPLRHLLLYLASYGLNLDGPLTKGTHGYGFYKDLMKLAVDQWKRQRGFMPKLKEPWSGDFTKSIYYEDEDPELRKKRYDKGQVWGGFVDC